MKKILSFKYITIENARKTGRGNKLLAEITKSIIGIFFLVCISGILTDTVYAFAPAKLKQEPWTNILLLYGELFGILAGILYCIVFERRSIQSVGFRAPAIKPYLWGMALGSIMITMTIGIITLCGGLRLEKINTNVDIVFHAFLLGGFVIQGMSEEILFRGYVFVSISRKNSILAAILVNSFLFSLIHIFNDGFTFLPFVNLAIFGILESILFLKTDNIWAAAAVHSIWNYMQGGFFGLNVSGTAISDMFLVFMQRGNILVSGGKFGPEGSLVTTGVLLVVIYYLVRSMEKGET